MFRKEFTKLSPGYTIGKKLGSGVSGDVYKIKENPDMIVKVQPLVYFYHEVPILVKMSRKGISPKVRGIYTGKTNGYIVMDRFDGTLMNLIKKKDSKISKLSMKRLTAIIKKMHRSGILHMNLHAGNIVYRKKKDGTFIFKVIDPGQSKDIKTHMKTKKNVVRQIKKHYKGKHLKMVVQREVGLLPS